MVAPFRRGAASAPHPSTHELAERAVCWRIETPLAARDPAASPVSWKECRPRAGPFVLRGKGETKHARPQAAPWKVRLVRARAQGRPESPGLLWRGARMDGPALRPGGPHLRHDPGRRDP